MKKKVNLSAALFASAVMAFGTCAVVAPVQAADKPMNSKAAGPKLQEAKKAIDAKKYPDAINKLKEVQGISGKNPYDDFVANQMLSFAYLKTNNYAEAEKVLEPMLNSEFVPKSELPTRVKQLLTINYQLKNYDKVIQFGDTAQKGGFADEEIQTLIGQAYYLKGDYKKSTAIMDGIIQNITKSGKKPKEQTLILVQNACTKSGDNGCLQRTYEQLVTYYPKPIYWQNLVDAMYKTQAAAPGGNNDKNMLQVYRLAAAVDVLKKSSDYTEYAQLALERGSPGEAQAVLEKGFANKIFTEKRDIDRNQRLLDSAKKAAAADPSALAAKATTTGTASDPDVSMGLAYLGASQYDKAVEAINRSLAKNPQNPDARLTLGIAELRAGRKDEARKAFKAVKGDPTLERLANLWTLHSQA
jgi:tetratricopeptide (TPR) repeat protein